MTRNVDQRRLLRPEIEKAALMRLRDCLDSKEFKNAKTGKAAVAMIETQIDALDQASYNELDRSSNKQSVDEIPPYLLLPETFNHVRDGFYEAFKNTPRESKKSGNHKHHRDDLKIIAELANIVEKPDKSKLRQEAAAAQVVIFDGSLNAQMISEIGKHHKKLVKSKISQNQKGKFETKELIGYFKIKAIDSLMSEYRDSQESNKKEMFLAQLNSAKEQLLFSLDGKYDEMERAISTSNGGDSYHHYKVLAQKITPITQKGVKNISRAQLEYQKETIPRGRNPRDRGGEIETLAAQLKMEENRNNEGERSQDNSGRKEDDHDAHAQAYIKEQLSIRKAALLELQAKLKRIPREKFGAQGKEFKDFAKAELQKMIDGIDVGEVDLEAYKSKVTTDNFSKCRDELINRMKKNTAEVAKFPSPGESEGGLDVKAIKGIRGIELVSGKEGEVGVDPSHIMSTQAQRHNQRKSNELKGEDSVGGKSAAIATTTPDAVSGKQDKKKISKKENSKKGKKGTGRNLVHVMSEISEGRESLMSLSEVEMVPIPAQATAISSRVAPPYAELTQDNIKNDQELAIKRAALEILKASLEKMNNRQFKLGRTRELAIENLNGQINKLGKVPDYKNLTKEKFDEVKKGFVAEFKETKTKARYGFVFSVDHKKKDIELIENIAFEEAQLFARRNPAISAAQRLSNVISQPLRVNDVTDKDLERELGGLGEDSDDEVVADTVRRHNAALVATADAGPPPPPPVLAVPPTPSRRDSDFVTDELSAIIDGIKTSIESQTDNPNPKKPYRGIGVKCDLDRGGDGKVKALKVKEIFSKEIGRFNNDGQNRDITGYNITHIFNNGQYIAIQ